MGGRNVAFFYKNEITKIMNMAGEFKKAIITSGSSSVVVTVTKDGALNVETHGNMGVYAKKGEQITLIMEK